jgi:glucokinase
MTTHHQLTFGVDLGGTSTRVGLYDASMQLIDSRSMTTRVSAGPQSCVEEMAEAIASMNYKHSAGRSACEVLGIGIGSPGPMNLRTGVLGLLPNLPGWDNFPLRDALIAASGMPVVLESDANAAAIAEWKLGAGQSTNLDSMAMITLGTGVGSGLILGGQIWHGMFGMGGEVGHATVVPDGLVCGCGSRGCLEMYASANGLLRLAIAAADTDDATPALKALVTRSLGFTPIDVAELAQNDPSAQQVFDRIGHFLGIGIANLINTLDLPLIVVGGGMAPSWNLFAPSMFRAIRDYSLVYRLATPAQVDTLEPDRTFICPAMLGPSAGLLGAALLPRLTKLNGQSASGFLAAEIIR